MKIDIVTLFPEMFDGFGENGQEEQLTVRTHRTHKTFDLLSFEGYGNVNDVESFVGGTLRISEDMLLDLPRKRVIFMKYWQSCD